MRGSVNVPGLTLPDAKRLLTAKELIYDPVNSKLDAATIQEALDLLAEIKAAALHAARHAADGADPITPAAIGAAAASHGTHVSFSTAVPVAPGTAAVGTATTVARSDHRHPLQTTVSGNAGTATKLETARTILINLAGAAAASFDGSANVTPGVSGILPVKNGGSGKSSWTANRLIYPSAGTTLAQLAFPATAGSVLRQGTSGAPYWTSPEDLLAAIGGAKIQTGSYVGTGTYGSANPCSLTLDFAPQIWGVFCYDSVGSGFLIINGSGDDASRLSLLPWGVALNHTGAKVYANYEDCTVSWYSDNGVTYQANVKGCIYYYYAIG